MILVVKQIGELAPLSCPTAVPDFIGFYPIFSHIRHQGAALRNGPLSCCVWVGALSSYSMESSCGGSCGGGGCHGYYWKKAEPLTQRCEGLEHMGCGWPADWC